MRKREESDSGLRAGFIRGDELTKVNPVPAQPIAEVEPQGPSEPAETAETTSSPTSAGPSVSVQGVSGKLITGFVKIVKKASKEAKDETEEHSSVDNSRASEPVVGEPVKSHVAEHTAVETKVETTATKIVAETTKVASEAPKADAPKESVKETDSVAQHEPKERKVKKVVTTETVANDHVAPVQPEMKASKQEEDLQESPKPVAAPIAESVQPETVQPVVVADVTTAAPEVKPVMESPVQQAERRTESVSPDQNERRPRPQGNAGDHTNRRPQEQRPSQQANRPQEQRNAVRPPSGPNSAEGTTERRVIYDKPPEPTPRRVVVDQAPVATAAASSDPAKTPFRPQKGSYLGREGQFSGTPSASGAPYSQSQSGRRNQTPSSSGRPQQRGSSYHSGSNYNQGTGSGSGSGYSQSSGSGSGYNQGPRTGGYSQGPRTGGYNQGPRTGGYNQGSGYNQGPRTGAPRPSGPPSFGGDKDREEAPRQTRSPKQQARKGPAGRAAAPAAPLPDVRKVDNRRFSNTVKDKSRRDEEAAGRNRSRTGDDFGLDLDSKRGRRRKDMRMQPEPQRAVLTNVKLPEQLTVKELAEAIKKTSAEVISKLIGYGVMATVNQEIEYATAEVICNEYDITVEPMITVSAEDILFDDKDDPADEGATTRPPVVVVMGHVDHGKTSILDYIRKTRVASGEAGGITQHIGAYTVPVQGRSITFLDTPGHEAFTAMRARGAQVTDIAILVVAADDGVMPQTIEAIRHARAANTEIIVAINKIDKHGINLDRVKQELAQHELMAPDWGGTTTMVPVSAKTGEGMDELLDMIILTADVLDLKANPDRQAKGTIISAKLDRARGPVATVLIQRGTLNVGDMVVVGSSIGNVRAMTNDRGQAISNAGPSIPVEILGLSEVPEDGDIFYVVENERLARSLAERRRAEEREKQLHKGSRVSLENLFEKMAEGETKDLNVIIKADVQGSVEAITQSLERLSNEEVKVQVVHGAVGAITESDVRLAEVSNAIIIGFNVRPASNVTSLADASNVDIRLYRVIYEAIEDIEKARKGLLAPEFREHVLGHAEVRQTYRLPNSGTVAGCYVTDGKILRNSKIRLVRDGIVVHEGSLASLRRFKDDVKEVATGYECGLGIERFNDIKEGDQIEAFEIQTIERT